MSIGDKWLVVIAVLLSIITAFRALEVVLWNNRYLVTKHTFVDQLIAAPVIFVLVLLIAPTDAAFKVATAAPGAWQILVDLAVVVGCIWSLCYMWFWHNPFLRLVAYVVFTVGAIFFVSAFGFHLHSLCTNADPTCHTS